MPHKSQKMIQGQLLKFVALCKKAILLAYIKTYNFFIRLAPKRKKVFSLNPLAREIEQHSVVPTDISAHLMTIFAAGVEAQPRMIVELGTRGGESTFVLKKIAKHFDSKMLCVDLDDCADACAPEALFFQGDDIEFAKKFTKWCAEKNIPSQIDLLFIDTSHEFYHTQAEINSYFPFLSDNATVIFHDTNMKDVYVRHDGSLGYGYCENIKRGVIHAIEEYLGVSFYEKKDFIDYVNGWIIKHRAISSGLIVMKKIS